MKTLEQILKTLEQTEFLNKKSYNKSDLLKKSKIIENTYDLSIFSERLRTYCCPMEIFKGVYGITPNIEGYDFNTNTNGEKVITLLSTLSEHKKLEWIFRKTFNLVINLVKHKGILDSETEAYVFGYLVSEQINDFISIDNLLEDIENKKLISGIIKEKVRYIMLSSGIYKDKEDNVVYQISSMANGTVQSLVGKNKFIMMIPRSKKRSLKSDLNIWSHELYHISRNSYGVLNMDYYRLEDLLVDYMNISLPILKNLVKNG